MADPLAEAALDHRPGDQERGDDQDDGAVGESGPRRRGRDDAREDCDGDREQGRGQDRQGPDTTEKMAAAKSAKRCHGAAVRPSGTGVNQSPTASARLAILAIHGERVVCTAGRSRRHRAAHRGDSLRYLPLNETARACTTPCSPGRTYCHVNV